MSHTFEGPSGRFYFHNGDFSGSIQLAADPGEEEGAVIPFKDLEALYMKYLGTMSLEAMEQVTTTLMQALLVKRRAGGH